MRSGSSYRSDNLKGGRSMLTPISINPRPPSRREAKAQVQSLLAGRPDLAERLRVVRNMGRRVSASEVHLTTTCNIRCKGCWYFEGGFDGAVREMSDPVLIAQFVDSL